jgi:TDG/mug DNA glycosylase family protein
MSGRSSTTSTRPTREELAAAEGKGVRDVIASGLVVLFCGVNPSLWSAAVGHHFAHPSNRFWKILYRAGFTDHLLAPGDDQELLEAGLGITNLVNRATRKAAGLTAAELRAGAQMLERKVRRQRPAFVAILGVSAYRAGFGHPSAVVGPQSHPIAQSGLWVLPNPSGLQAQYQDAAMVEAFRALRDAARQATGRAGA